MKTKLLRKFRQQAKKQCCMTIHVYKENCTRYGTQRIISRDGKVWWSEITWFVTIEEAKDNITRHIRHEIFLLILEYKVKRLKLLTHKRHKIMKTLLLLFIIIGALAGCCGGAPDNQYQNSPTYSNAIHVFKGSTYSWVFVYHCKVDGKDKLVFQNSIGGVTIVDGKTFEP